MILNLREVNEILDKEIILCFEHPDSSLSADQQNGFRNGLRQAEYLINTAEQKLRDRVDALDYMLMIPHTREHGG